METTNNEVKVCVTGGSGYIASWLIKKLLEKGYTVHSTLRNIDDTSKVGLLKSLTNTDTKLLLFQADINNPYEFEPAIQGCKYVFHVATPLLGNGSSSKVKDAVEAAIDGVRTIADISIKSQTVKRIIYTASAVSASPLREDGAGFKPYMDESCWTPFNLQCSSISEFLQKYLESKTLSEAEILTYNEEANSKLQVVSLVCGLVGGDTLLPSVTSSLAVAISQLTGNFATFNSLRFLQEILGSVPLLHIDDVCEAHLFCMEKSSMKGRFICAVGDPTLREIAEHYRQRHPHCEISEEFMEPAGRGSKCDNSKLINEGFKYKYDITRILDDSVDCERRLGVLSIN